MKIRITARDRVGDPRSWEVDLVSGEPTPVLITTPEREYKLEIEVVPGGDRTLTEILSTRPERGSRSEAEQVGAVWRSVDSLVDEVITQVARSMPTDARDQIKARAFIHTIFSAALRRI